MEVNAYDQFSVLFWEDNVMLGGGASFPLGQITTDFLNMDEQILAEIDKRVREFTIECERCLYKNNDAVIPCRKN